MAVKTVVHHGAKMLRQTPDLVKAQELGDRTESGEGPEYVFDVEPEDIDMAKPFLPAGSSEDQAQVAERKIEELKKSQAGRGDPPVENSSYVDRNPAHAGRPMTPEENRALDEEILRKEQQAEMVRQAVPQDKPRPKLQFGKR